MDVLRLKIEAGVYEQSQSFYRSRGFVVLKKNGKLRIVHELQPLNKVTIRDAGMMPVLLLMTLLIILPDDNATLYLIYFGDLMPVKSIQEVEDLLPS